RSGTRTIFSLCSHASQTGVGRNAKAPFPSRASGPSFTASPSGMGGEREVERLRGTRRAQACASQGVGRDGRERAAWEGVGVWGVGLSNSGCLAYPGVWSF